MFRSTATTNNLLTIRHWLLTTALKILEVDPCNAELLSGVAELELELSMLSEAMGHYKKSLKIREAEFGCDHPDVATTQDNIGIVLTAQGKHPEALKMHEKALKTCVAVLGPQHLDTAKTYNKCVFTLFFRSTILNSV
jgi:tetratricopeptide (TPR) repeat protein